MAVRLAGKWGGSVKLASQAALLHDSARRSHLDGLTHASSGAELARRRFGIKRLSVWRAIRRHTLGAPRMSLLDKIIYLADHLETGRDYRGVKDLRLLAFKDLNEAVLATAESVLRYLREHDRPIDPRTLKTRNYYRSMRKR